VKTMELSESNKIFEIKGVMEMLPSTPIWLYKGFFCILSMVCTIFLNCFGKLCVFLFVY
jgi:hypothetical protein